MRILHVINSLIAAGAENLVVTIANGQVKTQEVSIFTFYSESDAFHTKLDEKVKLYRNKGPRYFSAKKLRQLNGLIKEHDVVHVHLFPPLYAVALLSLFNRKTKFFFTEHSTHNSRRKAPFWLLEKVVYSRYEKIICISEGASNELKKWLRNVDVEIINNVIDKNRIEESEEYSRSDFNLKDDHKLLIMIGRFYKQKDQDTLIRALALLPEEYILLLVGYGPRETELKNLTDQLELGDRVRFLGARTDVFSIIKLCNYGILSSHREGLDLLP